ADEEPAEIAPGQEVVGRRVPVLRDDPPVQGEERDEIASNNEPVECGHGWPESYMKSSADRSSLVASRARPDVQSKGWAPIHLRPLIPAWPSTPSGALCTPCASRRAGPNGTSVGPAPSRPSPSSRPRRPRPPATVWRAGRIRLAARPPRL